MSEMQEISRQERIDILHGAKPEPEALEIYDPTDISNRRLAEDVRAIRGNHKTRGKG